MEVGSTKNPDRLDPRRVELGPYGQEHSYILFSGAPNVHRVIPEAEMESPARMDLSGQILNKMCKPVTIAKVEIWYAGGNPSMNLLHTVTHLQHRSSAFVVDRNLQSIF